MLSLLSRPRWIALGVVAVLVALGCVRLGVWQLHRHEERIAFNDAVTAASTTTPTPVGKLMAADGRMPASVEWRRATAEGRYDRRHELLLRNQTYQGQVGYHVLTPLVPSSGTALLVNRGWVQAGDTAAARPRVPPAPSGQVIVTGRLRSTQPAEDDDRAPPGQVVGIDVDRIDRGVPYPLFGGYAELTEQRPSTRPAPVPIGPPELGIGPHLAYAWQWWLFAVIALVGWVLLLRREAAEQTARQQSQQRVKEQSPQQPHEQAQQASRTVGKESGWQAPSRTTP